MTRVQGLMGVGWGWERPQARGTKGFRCHVTQLPLQSAGGDTIRLSRELWTQETCSIRGGVSFPRHSRGRGPNLGHLRPGQPDPRGAQRGPARRARDREAEAKGTSSSPCTFHAEQRPLTSGASASLGDWTPGVERKEPVGQLWVGAAGLKTGLDDEAKPRGRGWG